MKEKLPGRFLSASRRSGIDPEDSLQELAELTQSAGAVVEEKLLQSRERLDPATLVGSGKLEELRQRVGGRDSALLIFDFDLTPTQQRNIEAGAGCRVVDRTQLILHIFARHARTREGKLQVELAQLNYLLPRLAGRGVEMSRLGGGIGTRGPGETQLEMDRRRIRRRIRLLEGEIESVRDQRTRRRSRRATIPMATVPLVGYTNAGKSTLFNRLTHARVLTSPQMFATLDPTLRLLELPSRRRVLVSDTVGFIRNLPHTLIKAFRATLEEVVEADLILMVSDCSAPGRAQQAEQVEKVLEELGAQGKPVVRVWNKIDLLGPEQRLGLQALLSRSAPPLDPSPEGSAARRVWSGPQGEAPEQNAAGGQALLSQGAGGQFSGDAALVSARTGEGMEALLRAIDQRLKLDPLEKVQLRFEQGEGKELSWVYECGRVLRRHDSDGFITVDAELPHSLATRLQKHRTLSDVVPQ